jgi:hypothetical protein
VVSAIAFATAVPDVTAEDFRHRLRDECRCKDVPTLSAVAPAFRWLPDSAPLRIGRDALVSKPLACSEIERTVKRLLGAPTVPLVRL